MDSTALNLHWAYGFSKDKLYGVHSLCLKDRNALFFASSHSGVIYDFEHRTQSILQGHCNIISACVVDADKRWIVTVDSGAESIMVVWDSTTFVPVKTYTSPHTNGVVALDISDDALFIVTLSAVGPEDHGQDIAIWAWTQPENEPIFVRRIESQDNHHSVRFDPSNKFQIISTGPKSVCFWNWDDYNLDFYVGKVSRKDLGHFSGNFVASVYLPGTENAVTATSDGYVITWESQSNTLDKNDMSMKVATKVLRLVECEINIMITTFNEYLVLGCADGGVRFYDYFLRLEAWFEDLNAGAITSFSFALQSCPYPAGEAGSPGLKFWVPDFIVGTSDAFIVGVESSIFDEVRKEDRRGTLLMQGMSDEVTSVSCHPSKPLLAVNCASGVLQVWNYEMKLLMNLREFNSLKTEKKSSSYGPTRCIAYDTSGSYLAVGFSSGSIKLIFSDNLEDASTYSPGSDAIECIKFSQTGNYFAAYDAGNHVLLFKREEEHENISTKKKKTTDYSKVSFTFIYIGRCVAHVSDITGISFGFKENFSLETLVSIAKDRFCVEYDLVASTVLSGIICVPNANSEKRIASFRLESIARPLAVMWYPASDDDVEDRFVIANDEFKLKEINADSKQCRKTTLAPRFGTPAKKLVVIPSNESATKYYCYATESRVIGVGSFPLTGDPSQVMGLVAHPSYITDISVSFDGQFVFSAGGADLTVNMWIINTSQTKEDRSASKNEAMQPYYSLLEGGEGGELYADIVDYFYYCQLRHLGEDSMEPRDLDGTILLEEIPSLFRAVGYYPTEEEVTNMINEIRYQGFMLTGELQNFTTLDEVVKLYLNHRPVIPLDNSSVANSFMTIVDRYKNAVRSHNSLPWEKLRDCLTLEGEKIGYADLNSYLKALIGTDSSTIPDDEQYDAKKFAEQLLGFEDFLEA
eukprot:gene8841-11932_t